MPLTNGPGSPWVEPTSRVVPPKSTQLPFHTPYAASGRGGGSVSFTKQDSAPSRWELVMQFASVPAVMNATSSPNGMAAPSRVAEWNASASARLPASIQRMTSEIGAPFAGARAGVGNGLVLVTAVLGRAADGGGTACRDVSESLGRRSRSLRAALTRSPT